jgi:hypothetical protein
MLIAKLQTMATLVLSVALLAAAAGGLAYSGEGDPAAGVNAAPSFTSEPAGVEQAGSRPLDGIVTSVNAGGLVLISLGSDDGLEVGQDLDIYRLQPKPLYVGRAQVREVRAQTCVAQMRIGVNGVQVTAGDRAAVRELLKGPGEKRYAAQGPTPSTGQQGGSAASPRPDVRTTVERFLAAVSAGKIDAARPLLHPALGKGRVDALTGVIPAATSSSTGSSGGGAATSSGSIGTARQVPSVMLVQVDGQDALAITGPCTGSNGRSGRIVIRLKRATADQVASGWFAGDWLIRDVDLQNADAALTDVVDFLNRHPASRPVEGRQAMSSGN